MSRQSRDEGREELFQVLDDVEGVVAQKFVTQAKETGPIAQIDNHGLTWTREEWNWPVRVYVKANYPSAEEAQALVDATVDAVEKACNAAGYTVHGSDQLIPDPDPDKILWQSDIIVGVPREDF